MKWKSKESKKLIEAILTLETGKEAADFLCDLMTEKEIIEFSKRFQAAEMLGDKVKYTTIEEKTGLNIENSFAASISFGRVTPRISVPSRLVCKCDPLINRPCASK